MIENPVKFFLPCNKQDYEDFVKWIYSNPNDSNRLQKLRATIRTRPQLRPMVSGCYWAKDKEHNYTHVMECLLYPQEFVQHASSMVSVMVGKWELGTQSLKGPGYSTLKLLYLLSHVVLTELMDHNPITPETLTINYISNSTLRGYYSLVASNHIFSNFYYGGIAKDEEISITQVDNFTWYVRV